MPRGKAARSLHLIDVSRRILEEIQPAPVRGVCYKLFRPHGLIPDMKKGSTNRVSRQLTDARELGLIPWEWIVDETREPARVSAWRDADAYVETVRRSYRRDRWADQPVRVQLWSEKNTVFGTLAPVLREYGVTFQPLHGFGSSTTAHDLAFESCGDDRPLIAIYVGDWDCSGMHMSEVDLPARIARYGGDVRLIRVALTADDVTDDLPWFWAKEKAKDSRYRWYVERYGDRCWELDALSPVVLRNRVAAAIDALIDHAAWERADVAERAELDSLRTVLDAWPGTSGRASK